MWTRRSFLTLAGAALASGEEPVIDIHQHTNYAGRTNEQLIAHQKTMGVTKSMLLPLGAHGPESEESACAKAKALAGEHPGQFVFAANGQPGLPETKALIERYLKAGGRAIAEQKFPVECDSAEIQQVYEIAGHYQVPILMHFQYKAYNMGYERFYKMLDKYPRVTFIGHAQTFWANLDKDPDQADLYPKGPVRPGGITDRMLSDYPNFWGDLSAGSGLNALSRDENFTRSFLQRHQDKLMFGSDCNDRVGHGSACSGSQQLATVRRLAPDQAAFRKMLYGNAARMLKI